mmetsp:Transcript_19889/g.50158  ORF Transcript_19889/g.50158 Transcript_19889/m.50158 type:complete len:421 (+) Transcript_19889:515-1777(+)
MGVTMSDPTSGMRHVQAALVRRFPPLCQQLLRLVVLHLVRERQTVAEVRRAAVHRACLRASCCQVPERVLRRLALLVGGEVVLQSLVLFPAGPLRCGRQVLVSPDRFHRFRFRDAVERVVQLPLSLLEIQIHKLACLFVALPVGNRVEEGDPAKGIGLGSVSGNRHNAPDLAESKQLQIVALLLFRVELHHRVRTSRDCVRGHAPVVVLHAEVDSPNVQVQRVHFELEYLVPLRDPVRKEVQPEPEGKLHVAGLRVILPLQTAITQLHARVVVVRVVVALCIPRVSAPRLAVQGPGQAASRLVSARQNVRQSVPRFLARVEAVDDGAGLHEVSHRDHPGGGEKHDRVFVDGFLGPGTRLGVHQCVLVRSSSVHALMAVAASAGEFQAAGVFLPSRLSAPVFPLFRFHRRVDAVQHGRVLL